MKISKLTHRDIIDAIHIDKNDRASVPVHTRNTRFLAGVAKTQLTGL